MSILSTQEAVDALDYTSVAELPGKVTSILLPAIDEFIKSATGKDWGTLTATYTEIDPTAKILAGVLLVRWFDDPGQINQANDSGVLSMVGQLEAKALVEQQAEE
jgi:hypothetical protein